MNINHRTTCPGVFLALILAIAIFQPALGARAPRLSVSITSPTSGATLQPGATFTVTASSNVRRVEYSFVSNSYTGLTESYLGSTTKAPFSFTWTGFASAIIGGGGPYRLMARAYDSTNKMVTSEINVVVPGTFVGPDLPLARNTAASPYYQATLFNGATWVSHSQNSAVRPLVEFNAAGEAAEFNVTAPVAGSYEIAVSQYKLNGPKPQFEARVNGLVIANSLPAIQTVTNTNDFGREGTTTFVADLAAGDNRILLTSLGSGVLSISHIRIAQP